MKAVKCVSEEKSYKTVCPGVSSKHVKNAKAGTAEANARQKFKLKVCPTVNLALDVIFQN